MAENLEEIQYDVEEEQESEARKLLMGIPEKYFYLLLIAGLVALYLVSQKYITINQLVIYFGMAVIAILFMSYRGMKSEEYLTYSEALAVSEEFVKNMQRLRKVPFGDIKVTLLGRLRKFGQTPDEYATNVKVRTNEFLYKDYELIVDPRKNGLGVIGCIEAKTGFDPLRKEERKMYPTGDMYTERQKYVYGQTGKFE